MDTIKGPIKGYYIALRAEPDGECWVGYARVFGCPPRNYEDLECLMRVVSDKRDLTSPHEAWAHAEALALQRLEELPPRT